jgi:hypothetical protein
MLDTGTIEIISPIEYDSCGRLKCNADLHPNQGTSWSTEDKEYLIEWLDKIGLEEMSLALGRTETTLSEKARKLRIKGEMKPDTKARNPRLLKAELNINKKRKKRTVGETKLSISDVGNIIELRKSKTLNELATMYNVSIYTIFTTIKKATKEPTKVSEVAMCKNSLSLYHTDGGMQVAN